MKRCTISREDMLAQVPDAQNRNGGITGSSFLGAVLPVLVHSDERAGKIKAPLCAYQNSGGKI